MAKLKPCPFCGCDAEVTAHYFCIGETTFGIECSNQRCRTSGNQFYETEEDAIKAWNRRAERSEDAQKAD